MNSSKLQCPPKLIMDSSIFTLLIIISLATTTASGNSLVPKAEGRKGITEKDLFLWVNYIDSHNSFIFHINVPKNISIRELRVKIADFQERPVNKILMFYKRKRLEDEYNIAHYNVVNQGLIQTYGLE